MPSRLRTDLLTVAFALVYSVRFLPVRFVAPPCWRQAEWNNVALLVLFYS